MNASPTSAPIPPLVPGFPVIGNAPAMARDLIAFVVEQYKRLGPIFRVRALNQEFIIMAGPEANLFATQEGRDAFRSREAWGGLSHEFDADPYMQAIDGELHTEIRKHLKTGYSARHLLAQLPALAEIAERNLDTFQMSNDIVALDLFRAIVTEQLGTALAHHAPGKDLPHIIHTIRTVLKVRVTRQSPAFLLHNPSYRQAKQRTLQLARQLLTEHRDSPRDPNEQGDLIDDLLAASKQPLLQELLGRESQLSIAAIGPFIAGLDTVANECTFMLYVLLMHPDLLVQCREEADSFFETGGPTQQQLQAMGVLRATMMETLRRYPIAPAVNRNAAKAFIFAGYRVEEGQTVILATTASHFLPELWKDPDTFDITRFSEARKEHKQRGAYAPFGIGPHLCLGAGAAEAQIVQVLATLLHRVNPQLISEPRKIRIKMDPTQTLGNTFHIRLTPRHRSEAPAAVR